MLRARGLLRVLAIGVGGNGVGCFGSGFVLLPPAKVAIVQWCRFGSAEDGALNIAGEICWMALPNGLGCSFLTSTFHGTCILTHFGGVQGGSMKWQRGPVPGGVWATVPQHFFVPPVYLKESR